MKLLKVLGAVLLSTMLVVSCTSTHKEPPVKEIPVYMEENLDYNWVSREIDGCDVIIDKDFVYDGETDKEFQNSKRTYYIWEKNSGNEFVYIIEWSGTPFSKFQDPLNPGNNTQGLLKYSPDNYAIWTGISKSSEDALESLFLVTPKYKVVVNKQLCINATRDKAAWIVYGRSWDKNYTNFEKILDYYKQVVK